jgi:predicted small metal-binding protein
MQGMLCGCGRRLQANNYEELVEEVVGHLLQRHSGIKLGESQIRAVRELVAVCSYRLEPPRYGVPKDAHERESRPVPRPRQPGGVFR